ncbi:MAG: DUF6668 family protein [Solirubrobacteraceae bacterium]
MSGTSGTNGYRRVNGRPAGLSEAGRSPRAGGRQAGVERPGPAERLPLRTWTEIELPVEVWWLGVHGGAGESTLEELFNGSRAAGHAWPRVPHAPGVPDVVLVARTSTRGLWAAQSAMREWAATQLPVSLLGLVLIADTPGRLPRALRELAGLIGGGVPQVWSLPWVEAWRTGEPPRAANSPREVHRLLTDLRAVRAEP